MNIVLVGPAGTGKGTQTRRIADHFGLHRVASGELLRAAVQSGTPEGQEADTHMRAGQLVPDDVVLRLVLKEMQAAPSAAGCVLDGFPRNVGQAEKLDEALATVGQRIDLALLLEVSEGELLHRLVGRQTCEACGATYHPALHPSKQQDICDVCNGPLTVRTDDTEAVIRARNAVYLSETAPLVCYYGERGRLAQESGVGAVDEVWERVRQRVAVSVARSEPPRTSTRDTIGRLA